MKIAIEAQRIFRVNKHGMDFVVLEIIRCLQKMDKKNEYWIFVAPGEDVCLEETENFHIKVLDSNFYPYWEQVLLPRAVRKLKPDLLHCTSNTAPVFPGVKLIVTLHDVIFLEKKTGSNSSSYQNLGRIYSRIVVPLALRKCSRVVTVSNYEKQQISCTAGVDPSRIEVIHNGFSPEFNLSAACRDRYYLFFLGAPNPKKNTRGTLEAYAKYLDRSSVKLPLKIADLDRENVLSYLREFGREDIIDKIVCPGYIPHSALPAAYGGAAAFLYTSIRESFGIPQLEAMACGTPVIVSNTSALPEVAGIAALLVNPHNPDEIADALIRLETDESYRDLVVQYGLDRVKSFSWELSAKKTLKLYESQGRD